jgi:tetratricopeptide (TPR) repeat protein
MLRNAVELAERAGSSELESEARRRLAAVQAHVGELGEAQALIERAIARAALPPQEALAWLQQSLIQLLRDRLEDALRSVDRAMRLLRRSAGWRLPGVHAAGHMLRGRIYRLAGRPRRSLGALQHAIRLAQQAGERRLEMEATARLGGLLFELDRPEEAEQRLREALLVAGEIEDRRGQALGSLWLGTLLWEQGDPEGPRLLAAAGTLASEVGLGRIEALALAIQARHEHQLGRSETALTLSARALALLEANGAELADRIVLVGTRALLLRQSGEGEPAEALLAELRRRIRRENERIDNGLLRRRHRLGTGRLLEAALSDDGRVYPRVPLGDLELDAGPLTGGAAASAGGAETAGGRPRA